MSTDRIVEDADSLLSVRGLTVSYQSGARLVPAVVDAQVDVRVGEGVGIVGESGSGKSTLARAMMGLLPSNAARVESGELTLGGRKIALSNANEVAKLRGRDFAMVFQDPLSYLNPLMTIRAQIEEAIRLNDPGAQPAARVREMLDLVRLPHRVLTAHPHQLSGGMRQRVLMAIALACRPKLLIADEPTTALDVTTQAEILTLLNDIMRELRMSLIIISHDLGVVASLCDRVFVMYGGRTIESGSRQEILSQPAHPYSQALVLAARSVRRDDGTFVTLTGDMAADVSSQGCGFARRCTQASHACYAALPKLEAIGGHRSTPHNVRCFLHSAAPVGA
jgi:oligopeptide/dipeptide ABC transporter ATP-binding protein